MGRRRKAEDSYPDPRYVKQTHSFGRWGGERRRGRRRQSQEEWAIDWGD